MSNHYPTDAQPGQITGEHAVAGHYSLAEVTGNANGDGQSVLK